MGKKAPKLPSFCLNRLATRVRVRPPPAPPPPPKRIAGGDELKRKGVDDGCGGAEEGKAVAGRRVVVVVDPGCRESTVAVQWALSHAVQSQDTVVLVGVVKPSRNGAGGGESMEKTATEMDHRSQQMFSSMRSLIQAKKPGVEVEVSVVEGKERGPAIVGEAEKQAASLLVLGQKKRSTTWRLVMAWAAGGGRLGAVDYCIQNAGCATVAVRRKSRRGGGGYVITTKRHKDFWLLA